MKNEVITTFKFYLEASHHITTDTYKLQRFYVCTPAHFPIAITAHGKATVSSWEKRTVPCQNTTPGFSAPHFQFDMEPCLKHLLFKQLSVLTATFVIQLQQENMRCVTLER